jgi:hypothetical protein
MLDLLVSLPKALLFLTDQKQEGESITLQEHRRVHAKSFSQKEATAPTDSER